MRKLSDEQLSRVLSECAGPGLQESGGGDKLAAGCCCLLQAAEVDNGVWGEDDQMRDEAIWFDRYARRQPPPKGSDPWDPGRVTNPVKLLRAMERAGIA